MTLIERLRRVRLEGTEDLCWQAADALEAAQAMAEAIAVLRSYVPPKSSDRFEMDEALTLFQEAMK